MRENQTPTEEHAQWLPSGGALRLQAALQLHRLFDLCRLGIETYLRGVSLGV